MYVSVMAHAVVRQAMSKEVLVLVHPGSACGSADYNIGRDAADRARVDMTDLLNAWHGDIIVLDGDLSDELPRFPVFADAIRSAVRRARRAGYLAIREVANDPEQVEAIKRIASMHDLTRSSVVVSGAWYDPTDECGCVNSVIHALEGLGVRAAVADAVCAEIVDDDDELQGRCRRPEMRTVGPSMQRTASDERITMKIACFSLAHDGNNPRGLTAEVNATVGGASYREIMVSAYAPDGRCIGDVVIGLNEEGELRVLVTTDGDGDGGHGIAVYPERAGPLAIEVIEDADDFPYPTRPADSPRVR